jgi:hypothetical protein
MLMSIKRISYNKNELLKGLFAIVLFFSMFSIPGYTGKARVATRSPIQNEIIVSPRKIVNSSFLKFKGYQVLHKKSICANLYKNRFEDVIQLQNTLAKTMFDHIAEMVYSMERLHQFTSLKIFPKNSDEEFVSAS